MPNADIVTLRPLESADAEALTRCFERCYGTSYVDPSFYDPDELRARMASGRLRSVVAVAASGELVGHMGLSFREPGGRSADAGNTVVDPGYRGHGLSTRLGAALTRLSQELGFCAFHHYPTTRHPILQKLSVQGGGVETGLMLDYIPAETEYRELPGSAAGKRLAVTVVHQPLAAAPARKVSFPERYAELMTFLYARARLERSALPVAASELGVSRTQLAEHHDVRRGLLRLRLARAGSDLAERVADLAAAADAPVVQVDLSLDGALPASAIDVLRDCGFFYCALLPEYRQGDVLRLQRLREGRMPSMPDLVSEDARRLFELMRRDRV